MIPIKYFYPSFIATIPMIIGFIIYRTYPGFNSELLSGLFIIASLPIFIVLLPKFTNDKLNNPEVKE